MSRTFSALAMRQLIVRSHVLSEGLCNLVAIGQSADRRPFGRWVAAFGLRSVALMTACSLPLRT